MKRFVFIGAVLIALQLMICQTSDAQSFSVEFGSSTIPPAPFFPLPDDILIPGPVPVLFGGSGFEVNGFTYGRFGAVDIPFIDFSVDAASTGAAGSAVFAESGTGLGEQNYDVYRAGLMSTNILKHDGNGVGPAGFAAPLGMAEPNFPSTVPPTGTGVDGYDTRAMPGPSIYWTWNSATSMGPTASGADILLSPTVPGYVGSPMTKTYATEASLGLGTVGAGDNINALEVFDIGTMPGMFDPGDVVMFSLDRFSPSLAPLSGTSFSGFSSADIFFVDTTGLALVVTHSALGLLPTDNLTALSVPEPTSAMSFLVAIGLVTSRRRRRR